MPIKMQEDITQVDIKSRELSVDRLNDKPNARAWRNEPGQIVSGATTGLLAWMKRTNFGAALTVDEVAAEIGAGLRELIGAHAAVVLARDISSDELEILAATDLSYDMLVNHNGEPPRFSARSWIALLPEEPFFFAEATPHLQVFIGELWDFVQQKFGMQESVAPVTPTVPLMPHSLPGTPHLSGINMPPLVIPLRSRNGEDGGEVIGLALLWVTTEDGMVPVTQQPVLAAVADQAGGWLAGAMRLERVGTSYRNLSRVFANAIDAKDTHRSGHAQAVSYYASLIGRAMGLSEPEIERIEFAGLLHDLGKIMVPDAILQKQGRLTDEELEIVRSSLITGAEWLREVGGLEEVSDIVRHQGEHYNGSGYPDGLRGDDIPLGARILAVALRFTVMTKPRANRRAMSVVSGALESLAQEAGVSLDPAAVNAFMTAMGRTL
jgi:HD-GYP domain-containing protein (c-di-GMP phosphodiesterase class II)